MIKEENGVPSILQERIPREVPVVIVAKCRRNDLGIDKRVAVFLSDSQEVFSI